MADRPPLFRRNNDTVVPLAEADNLRTELRAEQEMNLVTAGVIGPDDVTIRTLVEDGSPAEIIIKNAPNAETSLIIATASPGSSTGMLPKPK